MLLLSSLAAAEPGQVLVGAATHAATSDVVEYEPVGALAVRGSLLD